MKKVFSVFLCLTLLLALFSALAVNAGAEEIEVTVGQEFAYNDQSESAETRGAWKKSNTSPDGCWKYMFYSLVKKIYQPMKYYPQGSYFCWNGAEATGNGGLDYALVRNSGINFHPASEADVCKVFICPAAGHLTLRTSIARVNEFTSETSGTPTGIAIWQGKDTQLYPTDGSEYALLTSTTAVEFTVEADVLKGEYIYIRINSIDGQRGGDAVNMENFVVYTSIDADGGTMEHSDETITVTRVGVDAPTLTNNDDDDPVGPKTNNNSGLSTGAIVGIVIAVVVVLAGAVVAVIVVKKKKNQ